MYRRVLIAVLLGIGAFFTAHIINLMVAHALTHNVRILHMPAMTEQSPTAKGDRLGLTEEILSSGLFGASETEADTEAFLAKNKGMIGDAAAVIPSGPPIDAARKIKLVGTVVGEGRIDLAVVEDLSTKKQSLYQLNDVIGNVGRIAQIRKDSIQIRQGSQQETLSLDYAVSVVPQNTPIATTPAFPATGGQ